MRRSRFIVFILILFLAGCKYIKPQAFLDKKEPEPVVKRIENPQLAKLILTPKREKLHVSRDPFKPLLLPVATSMKAPVTKQDLKVVFIGTMKVEDEVRALLQVDSKKEFFRVKDVIHGYTIESIDADTVVLSKENQQMVIKRSEVK